MRPLARGMASPLPAEEDFGRLARSMDAARSPRSAMGSRNGTLYSAGDPTSLVEWLDAAAACEAQASST